MVWRNGRLSSTIHAWLQTKGTHPIRLQVAGAPPAAAALNGTSSYNGQLMLYTALGYVHPNSPHTLREHIAMDASEHHLYHAENSPSS